MNNVALLCPTHDPDGDHLALLQKHGEQIRKKPQITKSLSLTFKFD